MENPDKEEVKYEKVDEEKGENSSCMQVSVTNDDIECIVCTNIPVEVMETKCCGSIICKECGSKLKSCPIRC